MLHKCQCWQSRLYNNCFSPAIIRTLNIPVSFNYSVNLATRYLYIIQYLLHFHHLKRLKVAKAVCFQYWLNCFLYLDDPLYEVVLSGHPLIHLTNLHVGA